VNCPKCNSDCSDLAKFENLNNDLYCPWCDSEIELEYDEDDEGESGWFWFTLKKK